MSTSTIILFLLQRNKTTSHFVTTIVKPSTNYSSTQTLTRGKFEIIALNRDLVDEITFTIDKWCLVWGTRATTCSCQIEYYSNWFGNITPRNHHQNTTIIVLLVNYCPSLRAAEMRINALQVHIDLVLVWEWSKVNKK